MLSICRQVGQIEYDPLRLRNQLLDLARKHVAHAHHQLAVALHRGYIAIALDIECQLRASRSLGHEFSSQIGEIEWLDSLTSNDDWNNQLINYNYNPTSARPVVTSQRQLQCRIQRNLTDVVSQRACQLVPEPRGGVRFIQSSLRTRVHKQGNRLHAQRLNTAKPVQQHRFTRPLRCITRCRVSNPRQLRNIE